MASRSFGRLVTMRDELDEAVTAYTARAAEKMRRQKLATASLQVGAPLHWGIALRAKNALNGQRQFACWARAFLRDRRKILAKLKIDTLVMLIGDKAAGKSNQMRSVFEEFELHHFYGGYPAPDNIKKNYYVHPDMDLFLRLSSPHEMREGYDDIHNDIQNGWVDHRRRYKVFFPAQVTPTSKLIGGEDLFIKLFSDFDIRRGFAVWLNPDASNRQPFKVSSTMSLFMSSRRYVSALAIDSLAAHPSANPRTNAINARLLADMLFRI